jgi:hypothetical protein
LDILKESNYTNSEKNDKEISKEMEIYDKLTWKENSRNKKKLKKRGGFASQESFDDTADNIFLYKKLRKLQKYSNRVPRGRYKRKLKITKKTEVFNRPGMMLRKPGRRVKEVTRRLETPSNALMPSESSKQPPEIQIVTYQNTRASLEKSSHNIS